MTFRQYAQDNSVKVDVLISSYLLLVYYWNDVVTRFDV